MNKRLIKSNDEGGGGLPNLFGAKAYYQLNDNVLDSSGNGYNATFTNPAYAAGEFSQAASFNNATHSYITAPAPLLPADIFSVSMWHYSPGLVNNTWPITQYVPSVTGRFVFAINDDGGLQISNGNVNSGNAITATPIVADTWQHIVLTKNAGSGWQIFVNASSIGTWTNTANIITNQNTEFGGDTSIPAATLTGRLDQIRIYDFVLNSTQITALFNE